MDHAVNAADVDERAVGRQGLDNTVIVLADLDLAPDLLGALAALLLGDGTDGTDDALAAAVDLGDLQAHGLADELGHGSILRQAGLGSGHEHADALDGHNDAALVVLGDLAFNDLATLYPDIAAQWHPTKNGALTPDKVAPASNKKAWWRCEKGHDYQAVISSRTMRGGGCPYCSNKKVLVGYNDLATLYPAIARQWHPTLNGALTPQDVTPGSRRRVWWQCSAGHTWQAVIYSRTGTQQCGCPVCSGHASGKRRARYEQLENQYISKKEC